VRDEVVTMQDNGLLPPYGVDDIKAVLRRYGISRFEYHIWGAEAQDSGWEGGQEPGEFRSAEDFFARPQERAMEGAEEALRDEESSSLRTAESGWLETRSAREEESMAATEQGPVAWDPPDDLKGARLPLFDTMEVPAAVISALQASVPRATVTEVGDGETVPLDSLADVPAQGPSRGGGLVSGQRDGLFQAPSQSPRASDPPASSLIQFFLKGVEDEQAS